MNHQDRTLLLFAILLVLMVYALFLLDERVEALDHLVTMSLPPSLLESPPPKPKGKKK
jgi:hypothetical protein